MVSDSILYLCVSKIDLKLMEANGYNKYLNELTDYITPRHLRQINLLIEHIPLYLYSNIYLFILERPAF